MINRRPAAHVHKYLGTSKIRQKRKRRRNARLILAGLLLLTVVFGVVYTLRLPQFQYSRLEVKGLKKISRFELENKVLETIQADMHLFGLIPYSSSLLIDDKEVEEVLTASIPRIKSVTVNSHLSGALEVNLVERSTFGIWCPSPNVQTSMSTSSDALLSPDICYDLDVDGYIFGQSVHGPSGAPPTQVLTSFDLANATNIDTVDSIEVNDQQKAYVFRGSIINDPIGQTYLNKEILIRIASFLKFLKDKNKNVGYIECDSLTHCDVFLKSGSRIILDTSEDLETTIARFGVAMETPGLKNDTYDYVDLRYGNKIFYKLKSSKTEAVATSTPKQTEDDTEEEQEEVSAEENNDSELINGR